VTCANLALNHHDRFGLLCAAVCHDVGHPGLNNNFLKETRHELALRYNDASPLENMHCTKLFNIAATKEEANIFGGCNREGYKDIRKTVVSTILHTDMVHHMQMIKDVQLQVEIHSEIIDEVRIDPNKSKEKLARTMVHIANKDADGKALILQLFMHSADVSNPVKPFKICQAWAMRCLEEFFAQGDQEKALRIPVQMLNDREKVNKPQSQIGFIEFVVSPLISLQLKMMPALKPLGHQLARNQIEWMKIYFEEASPSDKEKEELQSRLNKWYDGFMTQMDDDEGRSFAQMLQAKAPPLTRE